MGTPGDDARVASHRHKVTALWGPLSWGRCAAQRRQGRRAKPFCGGGGGSWRAGAVRAGLGGPDAGFTSAAQPLEKERKTERTGSPALAV